MSAAEVLEQGLERLAKELPPLRRVELRFSPVEDLILLKLGFDDARAFIVQHQRVGELAVNASARLTDVEQLAPGKREELDARVATFNLKARAEKDLSPVLLELRRREAPLVLRVAFDSEESLLAAWARHVAEGDFWVPTSREVSAEVFTIIFVTPSGDYADNRGVRARRAPPPGKHGVWLEIQPAMALRTLLSKASRERKDARLPRVAPRPLDRFATDLEVYVERLTDLRVRWANELSHGGFFVATDKTPPLRSRVRLVLTLPNGEVLTLPAEVVHQETYPQLGLGVQLVDLAPGALAPIEALLAQDQRKPHVLVVEDEPIWRSTLQRVLESLDVRVTVACDGREGMLALIDGYFDLDLVILDLHMPEIDGRGLIERVRRLGGDQAFKIFLFSAAPRAELESLDDPRLATEVFSKLDPLDVLASRVAREVGRRWPPPGQR